MDEFIVIGDAFICGLDAWMDIWGDPLLSGTIFMVSYGVTAFLIFRAAREAEVRERRYWRFCGFIFIFQSVNTNLDLHAMVWTTGRCLAHTQGWYDTRREIQYLMLIGIAILIALILLIVLFIFYRNIIRNIFLTLGVVIALGFTMAKGISYHDFAQFYSRQIGPFYIADYIEFSGVSIAFLAAWIRLRQIRLVKE